MSTILSLIFALLIIIVVVLFFIKIMINVRHSGGSIPYFISSGAMDATLDQEKKAAAKMIVETNAHKKMEEQSSTDPPEKN